ncbi:WUSCHEL-related homeobox 11-like [Argentina anserina]|uniref:WUSCHEL-related homeobox 11-like n=1 Tax=Argentina anserina TaxID=57926 RepID=UPI0021767978|nr:WUSCHEL-related homeobox 11-like [Potentilla anserina]
MEDHQGHGGGKEAKEPNSPNSNGCSERSEPIRSRWIPKPEQILILESIFNSGMVNPPKEETVRIRKLLEKFGSVGDANVFYWFQNRRSRSRRRQRQLQASLDQKNQAAADQQVGGAFLYGSSSATSFTALQPPSQEVMAFGASTPPTFVSNYDLVGDSSSSSCASMAPDDHFFSVSGQMGFPEIEHTSSGVTSVLGPSDASTLHFQSGLGVNLMMTVFINGVPTEVPRGPLDMKAMFGTQDVLMVHSSGVPLPINEFGFLAHSLQPGESYFLVSRPT